MAVLYLSAAALNQSSSGSIWCCSLKTFTHASLGSMIRSRRKY
jgi:hypothetical protein